LRDLGGVDHVLAVDGEGPDGLASILTSARPADVLAPDPRSIAHLAFTSGTTGRAKPTPLSHRNVLASARAVMAAWRWGMDDVLVHALPLQHGHGISGLHTALLSGSRMVVVPAFTPEALCGAVRDEAATVLFAVPTIYERLLAWGGAGDALRGLRLATTGSAGLSPRTSDLLCDVLGQRPLERYGLTETGYLLSNPYDEERRAGSVGFALPGADIAIVDGAGQPCADGVEGEIVARGPQVFEGYAVDPGGTPAFTPDGWFRTGDMAKRDPETGHIYLVGRLKELIITGGLNVYPREVELVLEALPGVAAAAVVGTPSERWGEEVTAFVVPAPGATVDPAALGAVAERELAAYKRPKAYHVVPDLPRNQMGKVVRSALVVRVDPKMI
jgi:malonyl-CoA/methylmalonyl-CoA synthetase